MSVLGNPLLLGSADQYRISRSLRFNSSDSGYCSRTFTSAGNRKTWTWSGWVKRSRLATLNHHLLSVKNGVNDARFQFSSNDKIEWTTWNGSSRPGGNLITTAVYRDPSSWYHVVLAFDTTQGTASDRIKLYINGVQVTAFDTASYPSQNTDWEINNNAAHQLGAYDTTEFFNGYLADVHFIDGQALTPSSFTETSATTGQLIPKKYTGTFTGNSFWLQFADNSAATATTLGKDSSGLGNNWTPNNLSVTAGAGNDSLVDTPTSYGTDTGAGGEVRGNYATLNPLNTNSVYVLSNGNLDFSNSTGTWADTGASIGMANAKYYCELTPTAIGTGYVAGICLNSLSGLSGASDSARIAYTPNGYVERDGISGLSDINTGVAYTTSDVIGFAFNGVDGKFLIYKNGNLVLESTSTDLATKEYRFYIRTNGGSPSSGVWNFGQRPFAFPVSGFKALCDTNLPTPVVAKPNTVMDVLTWVGNNTNNRAITGLNFSPDFIWIKNRTNASENSLFDAIRGAAKTLYSNQTAAELSSSAYGHVSSFDSAGFTLANGSDATYPNLATNYLNSNIVGWCWDAGSSTVTNTAGSITSSVRANASAGFSVVTWTSDGASSVKTIGHGLGVTPALVIIKNRDLNANWTVYHSSLSNLTAGYLRLNTTDGMVTRGATLWGSFSSTVFGVDQSFLANVNEKCVAYCFAPVSGYSSFGSYTGNGSADGPFVYTGFRPRWVLLKSTGSNNPAWLIFDSARDTFNVSQNYLATESSAAEVASGGTLDFTSNGFKIRNSGTATNASSVSFIYAAFAESPFQYARAR